MSNDRPPRSGKRQSQKETKLTAKIAKSAKKKPLGNVLCQHFLGALGVLGGKKCDFAILLAPRSGKRQRPFFPGHKFGFRSFLPANDANESESVL